LGVVVFDAVIERVDSSAANDDRASSPPINTLFPKGKALQPSSLTPPSIGALTRQTNDVANVRNVGMDSSSDRKTDASRGNQTRWIDRIAAAKSRSDFLLSPSCLPSWPISPLARFSRKRQKGRAPSCRIW